jgi:diaminopimelate decarboxylase
MPTAQVLATCSKAYLCTAIAQIVMEEGLDLDVVSGGELFVALRAGFPAERIHFHGNNKSAQELDEALAAGVGRVVVDNFSELALLEEVASGRGTIAKIWLRLAPGVQAHTHSHIQTGQEDTKFGFSIQSGDAERAAAQALRAPSLQLLGLQHISSNLRGKALAEAAGRLIAFAAGLHARHGFDLRELSPGGGWGVPMTDANPPAPVEPYLEALCAAVTATCGQHNLPLPHLVIEPGRSLVAPAGVAVYTVGARKEIPGVRTYVSVDACQQHRPALYNAVHRASYREPDRRWTVTHEILRVGTS